MRLTLLHFISACHRIDINHISRNICLLISLSKGRHSKHLFRTPLDVASSMLCQSKDRSAPSGLGLGLLQLHIDAFVHFPQNGVLVIIRVKLKNFAFYGFARKREQ